MFKFSDITFLFFFVFHSLRVNLDMAKLAYSWMISRDKNIPETVVRSSTIPEELGRISYLLSDKTGTLTQNEMVSIKCNVMFTVNQIDGKSAPRLYLKLYDSCVHRSVGTKIFLFCSRSYRIWALYRTGWFILTFVLPDIVFLLK